MKENEFRILELARDLAGELERAAMLLKLFHSAMEEILEIVWSHHCLIPECVEMRLKFLRRMEELTDETKLPSMSLEKGAMEINARTAAIVKGG